MANAVQDAKNCFFDSPAVERAVGRAKARQLNKLGGATRLRAKFSIKRAPALDAQTGQVTRRSKKKATVDATAKPGDPPYSHQGTLRKLILYGLGNDGSSMLAGPVKFPSRFGGGPEFVEHGGDTTLRIGPRGKPHSVHYHGNPFMAPAMAEELPKWIESWKGSIKPEDR